MALMLFVLALFVPAMLFLGYRSPGLFKKAKPKDSTSSKFRCVSILPGKGACHASRSLQGKRFLLHEFPKFPLSDCTVGKACQCKLARHNDRRHDTRRASDLGLYERFPAETERRSASDRRHDRRSA